MRVERDGEKISLVADIDRIMRHKKEGEDVIAKDLSDELVKVDVQGPLSYKIIKEVYGEEVIKNRRNPKKNMSFFTFNEIDRGWSYLLFLTHRLHKSLGLGNLYPQSTCHRGFQEDRESRA